MSLPIAASMLAAAVGSQYFYGASRGTRMTEEEKRAHDEQQRRKYLPEYRSHINAYEFHLRKLKREAWWAEQERLRLEREAPIINAAADKRARKNAKRAGRA
jgi:hypothetical protein